MLARQARVVLAAAAPILGVVLLGQACSTATVRRESVPHHDYPPGVAQMRWRIMFNAHPQSEPSPEECATGVVVGHRLVIGSRGGAVAGVDVGTGAIQWSTRISGGVDGDARFDPGRGQVYVGSDDGYLYALDPEQGKIRWSSKLKGAIERGPEVSADALFLATAAEQVYAVDPSSGKTRWQYARDIPEGFTIHGNAAPLRVGGEVYAGFSDGFLVALTAATGEIVWSRSLAAASEQFVDVDATPVMGAGMLFAASFSGGLYGLSPKDGEVAWHILVDGINALALGADRLYAVSSREGVSALSMQGNVLWRQGLPNAGDLTVAAEIGPYLVFSGSREGLLLLDRLTGKLLQVFDPARGMCAAPAVDAENRTLYVLANNGALYALDILW